MVNINNKLIGKIEWQKEQTHWLAGEECRETNITLQLVTHACGNTYMQRSKQSYLAAVQTVNIAHYHHTVNNVKQHFFTEGHGRKRIQLLKKKNVTANENTSM